MDSSQADEKPVGGNKRGTGGEKGGKQKNK
jgi:hypothetical protein